MVGRLVDILLGNYLEQKFGGLIGGPMGFILGGIAGYSTIDYILSNVICPLVYY